MGNLMKKLAIGSAIVLSSILPSKALNAKTFVNPFIQPSQTTNCYGSGDMNYDGKKDTSDLGRLDSLIAGTFSDSTDKRLYDRADVNGDEIVNNDDRNTLEDYLNKTIPYKPSQWNNLQNQQERENWFFDKMAKKIDKGDTVTYDANNWVSGDYAAQFHINFHGVNIPINSMYDSTTNGRFNIPAYMCGIRSPNGDHGMIAVLTGDINNGDPRIWENWFFFEPQSDDKMPPTDVPKYKDSCIVEIGFIDWFAPDEINAFNRQNFIKFSIKNGVPSLQWYDEGFVALERDTQTSVPVELMNFSLEQIVDDRVTLGWTTASETNNYGFEVERSVNEQDFEKVGFVKGNGTTNKNNKYRFTDKSIVSEGEFYYRLKQVDFDGTYEYSKLLKAAITSPAKYNLSQNFPNPFNPTTKIEYKVPKRANVSLKVYNILGRELETLVNGEKMPGLYNVEFNASKYASGIYFYMLKTDDFSETKKMVLEK